jgi:sensor domain CHASE-containing protein
MTLVFNLVNDFPCTLNAINGLQVVPVLQQDIGIGIDNRIQKGKSHIILFDQQPSALSAAPINVAFGSDHLG